MRVLISTYGSRGDVQPMVALAVALRALDVDVRLCAPPDDEFVELLARAGVLLVPAFSSVRDWVDWARRSGLDLPRLAAVLLAAQFDIITAAAANCDAIVATGLFSSKAAAQAVAEMRGLAYVSVALCPRYLPSPQLPPVEFPGWPHPPELTDNPALWTFNVEAMNRLFGPAINELRASLGLSVLENVRDHVFTRHPLLASDPVLGPWQPSDLCEGVQTGAWILSDPRALPQGVEAFLDAGPPPVYVGFGSMAMKAAPNAARVAIEAVRAQGRRVLLASGSAGLAAIDARDDCCVVGDINQQALFPRVAAVVHHGGAGTTTAAAMAGTPQLIVPQVADQPYWAERVAELGIGSAHDGPTPSLDSLSDALASALTPAIRERASALAGMIRRDGAALAAQMLVTEVHGKGAGR